MKQLNFKETYLNESFFDDIDDDIQAQYDDEFYDKVGEWAILDSILVISRSSIFKFGPNTYEITPNKLNTINVSDIIDSTIKLVNYFTKNLGSILIRFQLQSNNIINMSGLFYNCYSLKILDLNHVNTYNVTNMTYMFFRCESLESLYLNNFNTSNVTDMTAMFYYCKALTSLDLSNFNTSKVISMSLMFDGCKSLKTLDLSNFDTSNVSNICSMFDGCKSLESVDLSNFNPVSLQYKWLFAECDNLKYIKCTKKFRDWCWNNENDIKLPDKMQKHGNGIWEIVD